MNIEEINKRLEELNKEKNRLSALIHVVDGAIQDCEYWLFQLNVKAAYEESIEKNKKGENDGDIKGER